MLFCGKKEKRKGIYKERIIYEMYRHAFRVHKNKIFKEYVSRNSFARESKALRLLKPHPFVAELIASTCHDDQTHFIGVCELRYYRGCDLHAWMLAHKEGSDIKFVRYIMKKILLAYDYASKLSIFHRDIKPENVMINEHGIVKLIDWELCSFTKYSKKRVGTVEYMAEEVFRGCPYECSKSDVWSLGVLLFCLGSGKRPYSSYTSDATYSVYGNSDEFIDAIYTCRWRRFWRSHEQFEEFPLLPYSFKDCLEGMLKQCPDDRYTVQDVMFHSLFYGDEYTEIDVVKEMSSVNVRPFI